jgi:hypothetical protein
MSESSKTSRLTNLLANKQLFWLLLIGLVFLLSFWWVPGDGTSIADSYSVEVPGKHAFYQTIRNRLSSQAAVERSVNQLVPNDASAIVILGPARLPTVEEWDELADFVGAGGNLLYAADPRTEDFSAGLFGVSLENNWVAPNNPFDSEEQQVQSGVARMFGGKSLLWMSEAELVVSANQSYRRSDILIARGSRIQALRQRYGQGTVVFVASDAVFQNRSMLDADAQVAASQLFELVQPAGWKTDQTIYFDEVLNSTGTPRVLGILFTPLFRPLSLQMLLLAILFGWWGSRRFGPAAQPKSTDRRAIVEHAQALGSMHYKVGTASHSLKSYFDYFRTVAQMPTGRLDKVAGVLAARSGIGQSEIERLLTETQNAMQNPSIGTGSAATLIQQLANVRDRMTNSGKSTEAT